MAKYTVPGCGCLLGYCYDKPNCWLDALRLSPSADLPAARDEDPAWSASLAACYDPPDYQHPEEPQDG